MTEAYRWVSKRDVGALTQEILKKKLTIPIGDQEMGFYLETGSALGIPLYFDETSPPSPEGGEEVYWPEPAIELYGYQMEAMKALEENGRGILKMATGSGKTLTALCAAAASGKATLVIVHSNVLMQQWCSTIEKTFGIEAGVVQGPIKKWKWDASPVVVAMLQTLGTHMGNEPKGFRERFGNTIFDEVHHLQAEHFSKGVYYSLNNRWGLSATPFGNRLDQAIRWNFGDIVYEYNDLPIKPSVYAHWFPAPSDYSADLPWGQRILLSNPGRVLTCLELTLNLAKEDRSVLVMSPTVKSLLSLKRGYEQRATEAGMPWLVEEAGLLTGKTPKPARPSEVAKLVLFVTQHTALATEGLDRPQTEAVIVHGSCMGSRTFHQIIGRAARRHENKTQAEVHFLCDDFAPYKHAIEKRLREAQTKGLEVTWEASTVQSPN